MSLHGSVPPEEVGYIADKVVKAERRIASYPYDTEAWSILIRDAQMKKIEDARKIYERLVSQFPNAGRYWKIYIEHELYLQVIVEDGLHTIYVLSTSCTGHVLIRFKRKNKTLRNVDLVAFLQV